MKRFLQALISAMLLVCLLAGAMPEPFVASSAAAIEALAEEAKAHPVAEISALAAGAEEQAATTDGDGWIYRICPDGYAELIGYADATATSLVLPDALGGAWVVRLAEDAFADNPNLHSVTIPAQIGEIPDSAFPVQQNMTVHALNGTAALAFAAKRGFSQRNDSEYDFFDEILDLSELKPDQWSLSGSRLNLEAPYAQLVSEGTRLYLPPCGERANGSTVELSDCRMEGGGAAASFVDLGFADAFESYRADGVSLKPDLSSFRSGTEGVTLAMPRGVSIDVDFPKVRVSADVELSQDYTFVGSIELSPAITNLSVNYEDYALKEMSYDINIGTVVNGTIKTSKGTSWNELRRQPKPGQNARLVPDSRFNLGSLMLVQYAGVVSLWIDIDLVLSGDGEVNIAWDCMYTGKMTLANGKVLPQLSSNKFTPGSMNWSAMCSGNLALEIASVVRVGLSQKAVRTALDLLKVGYSLGIEGKAKVDITNACTDLNISLVQKVDWAAGLIGAHVAGKRTERWRQMGLRFKLSFSGTLWEKIVPWKSLHYESDDGEMTGNWSRVPQCTRDRVTVHFQASGAQSAIPDQRVNRGGTIEAPELPEREGYIFGGWFAESSFQTQWDFARDLAMKDMTLYAQWIEEAEPEEPELPPDFGDPSVNYEADMFADGVSGIVYLSNMDDIFIRAMMLNLEPNGSWRISGPTGWGDSHVLSQSEIDALMDQPINVRVPDDPLYKRVTAVCPPWDQLHIVNVSLPEMVIEIREGCFANCSMESIQFSNYVSMIFDRAFANCRNLKSITIPDSVSYIGARAFSGCTKLSSVSLPKNLIQLFDHAFENCKRLKTVELPDQLGWMGEALFAGSGVTSVRTPLHWSAVEPCEGRYRSPFCDSETLKAVEVPEGATCVPAHGFEDAGNLQSVKLPSTMQVIFEDAFRNCTGLTSIELPEGLTTIGDGAFAGCTNLTSITLPESVMFIGANAFEGCTNLKSITLPEGLWEIGDQAFRGCKNLTSVTLPYGVRYVGGALFSESGVSTVQIPGVWPARYDPDTELSPFANCASLRTLIVPEGVIYLMNRCFEGLESVTRVQLPSTLAGIGVATFRNCKSLEEIEIPEGVYSIDEDAFYGSGLKRVRVPANWHAVSNLDPESDNIASPFRGCAFLEYIEVPEGARALPDHAFSYVQGNHPVVKLPGTLQQIGVMAFYGSNIGPSLTLPKGLNLIRSNAFGNCPSLRELAFEGEINTFEDEALPWGLDCIYVHADCANVRRAAEGHAREIIVLPGDFHTVQLCNTGDSAMDDWMARAGSLLNDPGVPVREGYTFLGWFQDAACSLCWEFDSDTMPDADLTLYAGWIRTSSDWAFSASGGEVTIEGCALGEDWIELPGTYDGMPVTAIAAGAIPDGVRYLTIPAGIRKIDPSAFMFASDLVEIRVNATNEVYRVEDGALFKGNELIAVPRARASGSYDIPAGTEAIGSNAFYRCDALTQLNIPASVRVIEDSAISECRALESVAFEADVGRMGEGNLLDCDEGLYVTGPVGAATLTAYADENYLDYNMYMLGLVQDGELIAIITVRAGDELSELSGIDSGDARGFLGWSRTEDGNDIWNMEDAIMPAEDVLLYAVLNELFNYEAVNGGVRLTKYTGSASEIRVPDAVDGQPVVEIAEGCFPNNVTLIADRGSVAEAFATAHGMNFKPLSYTLHFETNGGRKIPDRTLCATDPIDLPTPTRDGGAFQCWCTDAALSLPWNDGDAMPAHDLTLYASWSALEDWVEIPFTFDELDGSVVITGYTGTRSTVSVPERINDMPVTAIANGAFENSEAHTVTLPATVRQIGEGAFAGSELSEIEMPGVTTIGARAFDGCTALSEVSIGTGLTELGEGAFRDCGALTSIALPDGLTTLGEDVFSGCEWLASVTLPANLSAVPSGTFQSCRRLRAIRLGAQVRSVASDAFDGCAALAEIAVEGGNMYYKAESNVLFNASGSQLMLYPQGKADEVYALPSGVTVIADGAMQGARMKTLRLNAELERIGADALRDCAYLERIDMNEALDEIGARAFVGCMSLADVTLPESVEIVGEEAFDSTGLTRIYVPAQALLGSNAIPARSGLTIYGHRGSEAESYAEAQGIRFLDESSDIPVTGIALSTDTLELEPGQTATLTATLTPGNTTEKEIAWFSDNEAVAFVSQSGEVEARGVGSANIIAMAKNGAMAQCALRVTRRSVKAEEIVLSARSIVLSLGDMRSVSATVLPAGAEDTAVTWSVENPDIAGWIGGCVIGMSIGETTLTATTAGGLSASCAIKVVEHLETIPMDAADFLLPDSLTSIEAGAFTGLAMTVVRCPNGLREIGSRAFADCGKLKQIYIPPSATSIAEDAFEGCGANLIIYGEYGTVAETYAEAHGFGFRGME